MRVHIPIVDLPADNVPLIVVSVPLVAHDGDAWRVPATPKPRSTSIDQQTGLVRAASMGEWRHPQGRHVLMRVVRMSASRLPLGQNGGEIITARIRTGWSITWRANRHRRGACGPTGTADALGDSICAATLRWSRTWSALCTSTVSALTNLNACAQPTARTSIGWPRSKRDMIPAIFSAPTRTSRKRRESRVRETAPQRMHLVR
jgi:hypothetical protein